MITQSVPLKTLYGAAVENGMVPLHLDGIQKIAAGITTIDEILRAATVSEEL
jgi:type II secretory ATPase GspE/PulE/Tfp pilus assembly ATPase PilB-like protein